MPLLTKEQRQTFFDDGVLVVDNVVNESELAEARNGLNETLLKHGVDPDHLESTGHHLPSLSSTNGSGGVLDCFYEPWKLKIAVHPTLFQITTELWETGYCHKGESKEDLSPETRFQWHPHGAFDYNKGYVFVDRIGYRIPTLLAQKLGDNKKRPIQRSLTPHLDCCPETYWETTKWRPIQCLVTLSDTISPNHGGFEAAKGFHREFDTWQRPPSSHNNNKPAPCLGEYTHIRPKEDYDLLQRIQHVPVRAGSAIFWDNRIPHANAYRHYGTEPRAVVYCSFLPDVQMNRVYVRKQLDNWKHGQKPTDQVWMKKERRIDNEPVVKDYEEVLATPLSRRLTGVEPWDEE